ncbi:ORC ubiquitin ligase 1 [Mantella aurantiaca]
MAHNVTLALTLPISCHICLGKVRQPVICVNHHVFCSICIDLWLKNNNQCPACRVPITHDNPCKDIIGGTSENESILSHSVRKHLRKTRLELLQKEYEDEIDSLVRETEELRRTNLALEERLNRVADPVTESLSCNCGSRQAEDKSSVCNKLLEDWNRKLEEVNYANKKVKEDIDKLKEENRRLKNENVEFVRENLRLKNEVDLRSPQKFGRFTVAALQAKVDQYEREMSRLKKALERSDQYIEELEAQIVPLKRPPEDKKIEKSQCGNTALMEEHAGRTATSHVCQDISTTKLFPEHSNDDGIHSDDFKGLCPTSAILKQTKSKTVSSFKQKLGLHNVVCNDEEQIGVDKDSPRKGIVSLSQDLGSPSSSLPFSSLQLNTPDRETNYFRNTNLKKPLTYLRKLVFEDLPQRRELVKLDPVNSEHNANNADGTKPGQSNAIFSNFCHIGNSQDKISEKIDSGLQFRMQGRNAADQTVSMLHPISGDDFPWTLHENTVNVNLNDDSVDDNNSVSHLENQHNNLTQDWVRPFPSDSSVHIYKSSEETILSHGESSKQAKSFSVCNSLSSSVSVNEGQAHLFMTQPSDTYNTDFSNQSCVSLQPEEEVTNQVDFDTVFLPGHISELGCLSSLPQTYSGSPPAKRKLLNPCNNSHQNHQH